jgi:hypothetical protein
MSHLGMHDLPVGTHDLPAMPPPNPWLMGVVAIGAGVTLWWLTPTAVRREEESSRALWGERSSWERWPDAVRAYYVVSWRVSSACLVIGGLVILGVTIARV